MKTWNELLESVWNDLREGVSEVLNLVEDAVDSDPSVYRGDVGETEVPPDGRDHSEAGHMTEEEYRREMWHWGKRVRRDIVALETWVKSRDPNFKPGDPEAEDPASTAASNDDLMSEQEAQSACADQDADGTQSDSGDALGGPQDEL